MNPAAIAAGTGESGRLELRGAEAVLGVQPQLAHDAQALGQRVALEAAQRDGALKPGTDVQALGDYYAALLHGLSVQARDGVGKARLQALIAPSLAPLAAAMRAA